ncbi:MAG: ubiquinol-cytochrome c reductase iron-sulfur subunit [Bacteroidota bacterium]
MTRKEFLIKIGIGAGVAVLTPVVFNACEDSETEPDEDENTDDNTDDNGDDSSDDKVDFTIDLSDEDYSDLQEEGGYVYENDIIIAYLGDDEYFALSKICTHNQCTVEYNEGKELLECPCHGSEFEIDGDVASGPAEDPLKEYNTELDGQTLRIYE